MSDTQNKGDTYVDNPSLMLTQQPLQVSTQAQDSSPPPALSTTPLQNVPFEIKWQRSQLLNIIIICIAIALTVVGTILWTLNAIGTIQGPWSNLFGPISTCSGVVISLIQLALKLTTVPTVPIPIVPAAPDTQPLDFLGEDFSLPRPNGQEGVLLVYAKRSLRGYSVDLCSGFGDCRNTIAAQNIVQRRIRGHTYYVAVFRSLLPGGYTAHIYKRELMARTTINRGDVGVIDWR